MKKMTFINDAKEELTDLVEENITKYKPNANGDNAKNTDNTVRKNIKRALLGLAAYYLIDKLGPDSNFVFAAMTYLTSKAALVYAIIRGYQAWEDFRDYI